MNTKLFKAQMILHDDDIGTLANDMKLSRQCLSNKMHDKTDFKRSEIDFIAKRYSLTAELIQQVFMLGAF